MKTALLLTFMFLGQNFNIELAVTPTEQATGLMFRKEWKDNSQGMLFVNKEPRFVSFWMKNTHLNLTMLYLDSKMNIVEIHRPKPFDESGIPSKTDNIQYILELNPSLEKKVLSNWADFRKELQMGLAEKADLIDKLQK